MLLQPWPQRLPVHDNMPVQSRGRPWASTGHIAICAVFILVAMENTRYLHGTVLCKWQKVNVAIVILVHALAVDSISVTMPSQLAHQCQMLIIVYLVVNGSHVAMPPDDTCS